jgi:hypothetical protein
MRTCARACSVLCSQIRSATSVPSRPRGGQNVEATTNTNIDFASLERFKEIYGHMLVPQSFAFDPKSVPGLGFASTYLGMHVKNIRKSAHLQVDKKGRVSFPGNQMQMLVDIGFVWNAHHENFSRALRGLARYREVYGDLAVPCAFTVPRDPIWDRDLWGVRLGDTYRNLRSNPLSRSREKAMQEVDIERTKLHQLEGEKVELALQTYRRLHRGGRPKFTTRSGTIPMAAAAHGPEDEEIRALKISPRFVVPVGDNEWPPSVWGMKLGFRARDIRHKGYYQQFRDVYKEVDLLLTDAPYFDKMRDISISIV